MKACHFRVPWHGDLESDDNPDQEKYPASAKPHLPIKSLEQKILPDGVPNKVKLDMTWKYEYLATRYKRTYVLAADQGRGVGECIDAFGL